MLFLFQSRLVFVFSRIICIQISKQNLLPQSYFEAIYTQHYFIQMFYARSQTETVSPARKES